ncbi:MAG: hypothetical protein R3D28_00440 [Geminicoccaceae bacterium]
MATILARVAAEGDPPEGRRQKPVPATFGLARILLAVFCAVYIGRCRCRCLWEDDLLTSAKFGVALLLAGVVLAVSTPVKANDSDRGRQEGVR